MTVDELRKLQEAMARHGFQHLELTSGATRLKLVLGQTFPEGEGASAAAAASPTGSGPTAGGATTAEDAAPAPVKVHSERVGLFSFGKAVPEVGQAVVRGKTLGIIKGVSIQDTVAAPVSGRLLEIHVREGDIVEFRRLLFVIAPDPKTPPKA